MSGDTIQAIGKWWSVQQVADGLNLHVNTVRRWLNGGLLEGIRAGRQWRIEDAALRRFMQRLHLEAEAVRAGAEPGEFAQRAAELSIQPEVMA